ncbi:MAG: two component transcriptional regulator, winged helix family [Chthonomonadaceae bacterium]|nr:two component transcriptional regulator, winged helix family [Chthonomonadaceae bacterium]
MRLLLIEDDVPNATIIRRCLEEEGYVVEIAREGISGLKMACTDSYGVIVLDLMLPGLDGWRVCEALRQQRISTPVLILTARGEVQDRVRGLNMGADDYLPKPFDFSELLARIRALYRRDKVHKGRHICIAHLEIDTATRRVSYAGRDLSLAAQEYALLELLARNEGRALSREVIMSSVWKNEDSYSNSVDVHIGILRRKLHALHEAPLIHTVRRVGYMIKRPEAEGD